MKFGKLQDISGVDFSLPADPRRNEDYLSTLEKNDPATVYIGCTGWSMKEWVGKVYPSGTKTQDFLREYAKQFNTIELNTTHYRIPDEKTIERWYKESSDDFRFCPKVPQVISHKGDLGLSTDLLHQFAVAIAGLQEKLGPCFMQLPPYFGADRLGLLSRFLEQFPTTIPLSIELRHPSWFESSASAKLADLLEKHRTGWVITDVAGRRDVLHMQITAPFVLVRFVGNNLDPSDYSRIDEWVGRIEAWTHSGLPEIFFFTHEPDNLQAPDLSLYLRNQLIARTGVSTRGPQFYDDTQGQMTLF